MQSGRHACSSKAVDWLRPMSGKAACPYRDHARLNRELAECLSDNEIKSHLFSMAKLYDKLAEAAETAVYS